MQWMCSPSVGCWVVYSVAAPVSSILQLSAFFLRRLPWIFIFISFLSLQHSAITSKRTHLPDSHSYTGSQDTAIHKSLTCWRMKEQCLYISMHSLILEYCTHIYFQITFWDCACQFEPPRWVSISKRYRKALPRSVQHLKGFQTAIRHYCAVSRNQCVTSPARKFRMIGI
jgi:hypothetical protein